MPYANPKVLVKFIQREIPGLKISSETCEVICKKIDAVLQKEIDVNALKDIIQDALKTFSPSIRISCLRGFKNYLHSLDFQYPGRYQGKTKWLIFTEVSESDLLKPIDTLLDEMILETEPEQQTSAKQNFSVTNFLTSAVSTIKNSQLLRNVISSILVVEFFPQVKASSEFQDTQSHALTMSETTSAITSGYTIPFALTMQCPAYEQPSFLNFEPADSILFGSDEEFIRAQKTIRINAVQVGNFGHLSATQTVMETLREELGFMGRFEVIYPKGDAKGISVIFNLPSGIPHTFHHEPSRTTFITLEEHNSRNLKGETEPLTLGMSGSADDHESPCTFTAIKGPAECRNVAKLLNVDVYASVTHHPSGRSYAFQPGDLIYLRNDNHRYIVSKPDTFFTAPKPSFVRAKKLIAEDASLQKTKPALNTFANGMEQGTFDVMSVYGRTLRNEQNGYDYLANIIQVIAGVRHAQLTGNSSKPIVIAVYHNYEEELNAINQIFSGTFQAGVSKKPLSESERFAQELLKQMGISEPKQSGLDCLDQIKEAVKELGLDQPDVFQTASISDVNAVRILQAPQSKIILLSMGTYSKPIFDGLYTRTGSNMLPAVREGYGTLSNLLLTGTPHFMCSRGDWDVGYTHMDSALKPTMQQFYKHFCQGASSWQVAPKLYKTMGKLINEARSPDSHYSRYFARLTTLASNPKNNRVRHLVSKSMQFLRGDKIAFREAIASPFSPAPRFMDKDDEISNQFQKR